MLPASAGSHPQVAAPRLETPQAQAPSRHSQAMTFTGPKFAQGHERRIIIVHHSPGTSHAPLGSPAILCMLAPRCESELHLGTQVLALEPGLTLGNDSSSRCSGPVEHDERSGGGGEAGVFDVEHAMPMTERTAKAFWQKDGSSIVDPLLRPRGRSSDDVRAPSHEYRM